MAWGLQLGWHQQPTESMKMGTIEFTLTEQIRDTIATHGLGWAVRYYATRMTALELRVFMRGAYLG